MVQKKNKIWIYRPDRKYKSIDPELLYDYRGIPYKEYKESIKLSQDVMKILILFKQHLDSI